VFTRVRLECVTMACRIVDWRTRYQVSISTDKMTRGNLIHLDGFKNKQGRNPVTSPGYGNGLDDDGGQGRRGMTMRRRMIRKG